MRLTTKEIGIIVRIAREVYGSGVELYLFGSRTNDTARGGDIDSLVRNSGLKQGILARLRMIAKLKLALEDWKIDVIGDYEDNALYRRQY